MVHFNKKCYVGKDTVLRNRNRRNRNRNKMVLQKLILYKTVFDFFHLTCFQSYFKIFFDETYHFLPCKKPYYTKRKDFIQTFFLKLCFLWCRYVAGNGAGTSTGTETTTCQKLEPEP
jgi:hypothetical protein